MPAEELNWLAVIVGTVAAFLFGWLLYSPGVFGRKWAEGSRVELGSAASMPVVAMATQFAGLLALALVVGITATTSALWTAIFAILAVVLFSVSSGSFVKKTTYALVVDAGYLLGSGAIMILAQGLL